MFKSCDYLELNKDLMEGFHEIRSIIDEDKNANEVANSVLRGSMRYLGLSQ